MGPEPTTSVKPSVDLVVGVYGTYRLLNSERACRILSAVDVEWAFDIRLLQTQCFIRCSLHASQHEAQFDLFVKFYLTSHLYLTTLNKMHFHAFSCPE